MVVGNGNARFHSVIDADLALMVGLMVLPVFLRFSGFCCAPLMYLYGVSLIVLMNTFPLIIPHR